MSSLPRDFILGSVCVYSRSNLVPRVSHLTAWDGKTLGTRLLEVTADLQPYRFEPERVPNPEDSERENEEVNDRLEGTFWCSCERCQIITTQRECVCCREQPEEDKIQGRILSLYCIGCSKWKNNFLCNLL